MDSDPTIEEIVLTEKEIKEIDRLYEEYKRREEQARGGAGCMAQFESPNI